jgi:integrase
MGTQSDKSDPGASQMPTIKMTKAAVAALPAPDPSGKQQLYWSEGNGTPGLGILVSGVSTSKSWVAQGNINGKARRITLGPVALLSVEQAWEVAKPKLASMLEGRDPRYTVQQRQMASMTVAEVFEDYLQASSNLKPATVRMYRGSVKHLGPLLKRVMREISPEEVERQFRHITADVVARRQAGKIVGGVAITGKAIANSAMRLFGSLWEFQMERDKGLGPNPVRGRGFKRQWHDLERRTRLVPMDKLPQFYDAACHLPSDIQRDVVLLGLYTGMREEECAGLRWSEVDLVNRMLHLPAGRMKGKKAFDLPMSDLVLQMLVTRRAIGREGQFVFFGYGKSGHCESFTYALSQIGAATGIRVSPHDLRRTFTSIAATCTIPPVALKMLISHSTGSDVTAGYVILSQQQLRDAAQVVADRIKELCGIEMPSGDNVRQFG